MICLSCLSNLANVKFTDRGRPYIGCDNCYAEFKVAGLKGVVIYSMVSEILGDMDRRRLEQFAIDEMEALQLTGASPKEMETMPREEQKTMIGQIGKIAKVAKNFLNR